MAESLSAVSSTPVEWRVANANQLPLDDQSLDAVLCTQSLQFMPEKQGPLREMGRVVRPGGRVGLSLWREIEDSPYFHALVEAVGRHIGIETAAGLKSAFALSDSDEIERLLKTAGFEQVEITTTQLDFPLPPLDEFVPRHISATPMAAGFSQAPDSVQQAVVQDVGKDLTAFSANGRMLIPFRSFMVLCKRS